MKVLIEDVTLTQTRKALSTNGIENKDHVIASQSRRVVLDVRTSDIRVLGLTSCSSSKAIGWSIEALDPDLEKICWKEKFRRKNQVPFCLFKGEPHLASDKRMTYKQQYEGKHHLLATDRMELCLGGSPNQRLTSKEFKRGAFSPCRWDTNQMWELKNNGTLVNSYSGLCAAAMKSVEGEIYVALFNLNPQKTVISAKISDIAKVLPGKSLKEASCECREMWSGKDFGVTNQSISMEVEVHGCALFVLNCD
ncbi:hypothetical protein CJ030_MR5G015860 [Morella rubra]|uniref:Alpha galactosidase C-terminal domain-containing protein n=1 Tax=Morella rubra TaxID=262757 RepID=A0A6A1VJQ5_9ROSI|nr:hypothetical protein CJ030_MR5G015860 [Morella rubra]